MYTVGDVEQEAGVDAMNSLMEDPCFVGGVMEMTVAEGWQRPAKVVQEKAMFMQEYGGLMKISTGLVDESCVKEES